MNAVFTAEPPSRVIGDKAYDSAKIERELAKRGIDLIAPERRRATSRPTRGRRQDGRKLRRYRRRWKVERLFAWLLACRRLVTRYERKAANFLGFAQLACIRILVRNF
jgi:transposase